jgi:hypothetical protein
MWKLSGKLAAEYFSGFSATKRLDHRAIINNLFTIVKRKNNMDLSNRIDKKRELKRVCQILSVDIGILTRANS